MYYKSTRNKGLRILPHQAIIAGLAADGGLYVPESFPDQINPKDILKDSYQALAVRILLGFLPDYSVEELSTCIRSAYDDKFDDSHIVPLRHIHDGSIMELFHGPTSAFKDVALTLLPHLLTAACRKDQIDDIISVLVATSGDTGKAALSGFANVPGTAITVFYPEIGVSAVQKEQMQTAKGDNVSVIALKGNFDDCQRTVKAAVSDQAVHDACHHVRISSANSINIGRLIPQIVYYFSAYRDLVNDGTIACGDQISFAVPTGNFGDILAGFYAKQMGLPIRHLICASNTNNVLTDFFRTGTYSIDRPFHNTMSPSMDILISSNLERLLYMASGNSAETVCSLMNDLKTKGSFTASDEIMRSIRETFLAYWTDEHDCAETLRSLYASEHVLIDPHTAIALHALQEYQKTGAREHCIVLSTASPFKFSKDVLACIQGSATEDDFEAMDQLSTVSG
ncbi:MAG: threonine synthase, partial [Erysipelotrichia bacterium]|nr:threonine synthase [Erysipelotrichia bacterium]